MQARGEKEQEAGWGWVGWIEGRKYWWVWKKGYKISCASPGSRYVVDKEPGEEDSVENDRPQGQELQRVPGVLPAIPAGVVVLLRFGISFSSHLNHPSSSFIVNRHIRSNRSE